MPFEKSDTKINRKGRPLGSTRSTSTVELRRQAKRIGRVADEAIDKIIELMRTGKEETQKSMAVWLITQKQAMDREIERREAGIVPGEEEEEYGSRPPPVQKLSLTVVRADDKKIEFTN